MSKKVYKKSPQPERCAICGALLDDADGTQRLHCYGVVTATRVRFTPRGTEWLGVDVGLACWPSCEAPQEMPQLPESKVYYPAHCPRCLWIWFTQRNREACPRCRYRKTLIGTYRGKYTTSHWT